jgi:uncharacterized protein (TIGR03089 family)
VARGIETSVEAAGGAFQSFAALAERQPGRYGHKPFLTWYDDARGERVELSYKTFDNWVAKVANLLVEELGAGPGDRVAAVLADHWQTVVVLAACWRAGAGVAAVEPGAGDAAVAAALGGTVAAFVREERVAQAAALAGRGPALVALTADLAGRSEHDLGAALRFARVVPTMGDLFAGAADPEGEALRAIPAAAADTRAGEASAAAGQAGPPAATSGQAGPPAATSGEAATMAGLLGEAARLVEGTGLGDGDRLLSGLGLLSPAGAAAGLLAPFGAGAGVVLARDFEPVRFWRLVAAERVTVAALTLDQAEAVLAAGGPPGDLDRSRLRVVACPAGPVPEALRAGFPERLDVRLADA